jgi:segregation and condensation protein B
MIETDDNMTVDDQNNREPEIPEEPEADACDRSSDPAEPDDPSICPSDEVTDPECSAVVEVVPAEPPPPAEPEDERLRQLEEIDRNVKESGAIEPVEELEYVPVPKRRRGAPKEEDTGDLELTSVAEARGVLEAFLFTTNEPVPVARLSKLMNNLHPRTVRGLLMELQSEYDSRGGSLQIVEVAGGFQMATRPEYADWVFRLHKHRRRNPLTAATLETLAIIAYKQPVTKAEIETIRGVESSATLRTLIEHGLVDISGRREVLGRPQLYATTELFLKTFGLKSIADLPPIGELKNLFAEEQKLHHSVATSTAPVAEDAESTGVEDEMGEEALEDEVVESVDGAEEALDTEDGCLPDGEETDETVEPSDREGE